MVKECPGCVHVLPAVGPRDLTHATCRQRQTGLADVVGQVAYPNKGLELLQKMGWSHGQTLGARAVPHVAAAHWGLPLPAHADDAPSRSPAMGTGSEVDCAEM